MSFYRYKAVVVDQYDGDTWTVNIDLGFETWLMNQKIRLYGINTPELRGEQREQGLKARDFVRELCPPGTEVVLESIKDKSGKYGRWLGIIHLDTLPPSVNDYLLQENHAVVY